jgi:hypothetical protein
MDAYPINSVSHPTDEMEMAIDAQARKPSVAASTEKQVVMDRVWGLAARVDETVTYEEYIYWAKIEREIEREEEIKFRAEHGNYPLLDLIKGKLTSEGRARMKKDKAERAMALQASVESNPAPLVNEKTGEVTAQSPASEYLDPLKASDAEWRHAARAMRTASWGQMFFLITTDILGWSGAP